MISATLALKPTYCVFSADAKRHAEGSHGPRRSNSEDAPGTRSELAGEGLGIEGAATFISALTHNSRLAETTMLREMLSG